MLRVVLYGREPAGHTHREGHKLRICENMALKSYFDLTGRKKQVARESCNWDDS